MKRAVVIIITIIIVAALFAVGVNAEVTDEYIYSEAELQSIMQISNYYYFLKDVNDDPTDFNYGTYYKATVDFNLDPDGIFYGRYSTEHYSEGDIARVRYPVSTAATNAYISFFIGWYDDNNLVVNESFRIDAQLIKIEATTQSGRTFEVEKTKIADNSTDEAYYYANFNEPILFFDVIINVTAYMDSFNMSRFYIGIDEIKTSEPVPELPTLEENIYTITQLIQMNITPAIENINNYITLIQQQEQTSINNLNQSNYNYNSTLNDYSSGTINADQAFNEITTEFDNSIENAVENGSVEEAILANQMYQSKLKTLEKYFEKTVASKYENLVSNEEKNMVDQAVQLEESILDQFDLEAFRAQTRYDTYYQQIGNQEMLNLKEIYEKILNDDIGNDFVIIPLTFSILAILLGATGALIAKGKKSND